MAATPPRPQFIAGAVCPSCHVMDRIVLIGNADEGQRRCVACGYSDSTAPAAGTLPGTRFSRPSATDGDPAKGTAADGQDPAQVSRVKIIDPLPLKR